MRDSKIAEAETARLTSEMNARLPHFVIIGTQKAGTTWLGARLAEQPGIFFPRPFEVHFFDRDDNYGRGTAWYAEQFSLAADGALVGEKTPDYFWTVRPPDRGSNDIPRRMHGLLPEARLVVVLRDPVRRAISAVNHFVRARWLSPFIHPDDVLGEALDPARDRYGMIGRGLYLTHLRRFLEFYPREQLHVMFFEDDLVATPKAALNELLAFLGRGSAKEITKRSRPENSRMNSRLSVIVNYHVPALIPLVSVVDRALPAAQQIEPSPAFRARLYEYFEPHNGALFEFLGRGTHAWTATARFET
jgi:hypothetical protein